MILDNEKVRLEEEERAPLPIPQQVVNLSPPTPRTCKQLPMVGWYDPRQLVRTGIQVAISTIFGRHSDRRLVEALASGRPEIYDYTHHYRDDGRDLCEIDETRRRDEIWIDYVVDLGAVCDDSEEFAADRAWVRSLWDALRPLAGNAGSYVNFISELDDDERVRASYGPAKYARLASIKAEYDPGNLFHRNANIKPA
jgi:hypothetical protein